MSQKLIEDFQKIPDVPSTNPALAIGTSATAALSAVYLIIKYFIPAVPEEVLTAVMTIIAVIAPIVVSWFIRDKVWSPASVQSLVNEVTKQPKPLLDNPKVMNPEEVAEFKKKFFKDKTE